MNVTNPEMMAVEMRQHFRKPNGRSRFNASTVASVVDLAPLQERSCFAMLQASRRPRFYLH